MFTNVKPAAVQLLMRNICLRFERRCRWWSWKALWSRRAAPHPSPAAQLACCLLHRQAGREPEPIASAVQRSFLDRIGHGGAKEGDDGARVVAAYHSAARHNHVGSGLAQRRKKVQLETTRSGIIYWPDWCRSFSPLHTCEWCQDQHRRQLRCLKKETYSSTTWPGSHTETRRTVGQNHRQKEARRERLSGSGPVGHIRARDAETHLYSLIMQPILCSRGPHKVFNNLRTLLLLQFCIFWVIKGEISPHQQGATLTITPLFALLLSHA